MANITFGHYAQDGNDFEGFSIHGGLVVPVTLTLPEEELLKDLSVSLGGEPGGIVLFFNEAEEAEAYLQNIEK